MVPRELTAWVSIVAVAVFAAPIDAQDIAANTIWGETTGCVSDATAAVLLDLGGRQVATSAIENGRFLFPNIVAGDYKVELRGAAGLGVASSKPANLPAGSSVKVAWEECPSPGGAGSTAPTEGTAAAASPATAGAAAGGGGGNLVTWLAVGGAIAAGVAIAIIASGGDDKPAPRPTPTPTPPVSPAR